MTAWGSCLRNKRVKLFPDTGKGLKFLEKKQQIIKKKKKQDTNQKVNKIGFEKYFEKEAKWKTKMPNKS